MHIRNDRVIHILGIRRTRADFVPALILDYVLKLVVPMGIMVDTVNTQHYWCPIAIVMVPVLRF